MNSPCFQFPFRHFPFTVARVLSDDTSPIRELLLFREIGGDKGLRNAVNHYWNVKKTTVSIVSDFLSTSYTTYATPAYYPAATSDENLMYPPMFRAVSQSVGIDYPWLWCNGGTTLIQYQTPEIVYLTDADRYALLVGTFTSTDYDLGLNLKFHFSMQSDLRAAGTWVADNASLTLPPSLELALAANCPGLLAETNFCYNSDTTPYDPAAITATVSFEYWQYDHSVVITIPDLCFVSPTGDAYVSPTGDYYLTP